MEPPETFYQSDSSKQEKSSAANTTASRKVIAKTRRGLLGKALPVILGLLLIGALVGGFFWWRGRKATTSKGAVTLVYWGLWEPESVMDGLIAKYEKAHPEVKIDYRQQSVTDYRRRLQSALASGGGPDIFRFHNTWLPMLSNDLAAVPSQTAGEIGLSEDFYPTMSESLYWQNSYYGVPLYFDSYALFYNKKLFSQAGVTVPTTWDEFRQTAARLTIKEEDGQIIQSGAALGTTSNVDHWSDILALMILQNGGKLTGAYDDNTRQAMEFYTIFSQKDGIWDETLPHSTRAFAGGKVAMYFAPSWRIINLRELNTELDFGVAPMPQLAGGEKVNWASYWVEGVSSRSENQEAAWRFLTFLSQEENLKQLYKAGSQAHYIGEIYPRKSMASLLQDDPLLSAFVSQADTATSWYLASATGDDGINDNIAQYFAAAINRYLSGSGFDLDTIRQGVASVLSRYQAITL